MTKTIALLAFAFSVLFAIPNTTYASPDFESGNVLSELIEQGGDTLDHPSLSVPAKNDTPKYHSSCCKICSRGKACGDSCISRNKTCTKGAGCACDG